MMTSESIRPCAMCARIPAPHAVVQCAVADMSGNPFPACPLYTRHELDRCDACGRSEPHDGTLCVGYPDAADPAGYIQMYPASDDPDDDIYYLLRDI